MRTFSRKTFLSLSTLLFIGMLVCFPLYYARAQLTVSLFVCKSDTTSNGLVSAPETACLNSCKNADGTPGSCTKYVAPTTPASNPTTTPASAPNTETNQFIPLTNLPGLPDETGKRTLADYINVLYRLSIGLGALVAVIKITFAGIKYMSSDAFSSKEEAKKDITAALFGLLIMLSTVVILQLIYPDILNLNVLQKLEAVKISTGTPSQQQGQVATADQTAFVQSHPNLFPSGRKIVNTVELDVDQLGNVNRQAEDDFITDCRGSAHQNGEVQIEKVCAKTLFGVCAVQSPVSKIRMYCIGDTI